MKKIIFLVSICVTISAFSQKDKVLLTIDKEFVKISEFKRVYEKNLHVVEDNDAKNIDKYLDLYINYKLKIRQAYQLKLDTARSYIRELASYKSQLAAPYLQDAKMLDKLTKEAYYRTKNEIKASHILVKFPKGMQPEDTVQLFTKIQDIRKRIIAGESFDKVAVETSEDPSVKKNYGNLGYFSAFRMVYPFENAAYKTAVGEVSKPFKTRFGYHIVKNTESRLSKGEFEVAHILAKDRSIVGKAKMDTVYKKLQEGVDFKVVAKKYSDDRGSAEKGGNLPKFGTGRMVSSFENAVFSLNNPGDYSKPFKTKFGWHVVKLIKKYPIAPYNEVEKQLRKKIKSSGRAKLSDKAILHRLQKEYAISVNDETLQLVEKSSTRALTALEKEQTFLTINKKNIPLKAFSTYSSHRKHLPIDKLLEGFKNTEIITYFKENLVHTEPEYKNTLQEYKDGLLLFDLMQKKIWNKSSKDTIGLQNYFERNVSKYTSKELKEVRGKVMSDYQEFLEKEWTKELREGAEIEIKKKVLKKFKKTYNQ